MLYYVARERHRQTIDKFLKSFRTAGRRPPDFLRVIGYETLFAARRAPVGSYVFTDLDRLTPFEHEVVGQFAQAVRDADPDVIISNWPNRVLGRFALLRRLYETGMNGFNVWRLDEERVPDAYPVFIRREQFAQGPETPLLNNVAEYLAAVEDLQRRGKSLYGRIAVQYQQQPDADGVFRKYGALYFRGRVVPQHMFVSQHWMVKRSTMRPTPEMMAEEERYAFANPHQEQIRAVFELAGTDFGRIDYAMVDDRMVTFEINSNPNFPKMRLEDDGRMKRRLHAVEAVVEGFRAMDHGRAGGSLVKVRFPRPRLQWLGNRPLHRRVTDAAQLAAWRLNAWLERS